MHGLCLLLTLIQFLGIPHINIILLYTDVKAGF